MPMMRSLKRPGAMRSRGCLFYYLAAISTKEGKYSRVLAHAEKSLVKNAHDIKARGLKLYII